MKRSIAALVLAAGLEFAGLGCAILGCAILGCAGLVTDLGFAGNALAQEKLDKIVMVGSLGDQSGLYQDIGGPGSTVAAQMAIEDSGLLAKGWKIGVISGDHQNKPDVGTNIAKTSRRSTCSSISPVPASALRSPTSPRKGTSST
jgi:ABC-type branched-subunit amino acid transport system substrate-binding protein